MFATQVVLVHAGGHLGYRIPSFLSHFPGVPAFFFVSGLLIFASYENSPGRRYFENRILRILPALVLVTLGGVVVALVAHGWRDIIDNPALYFTWFLAQISLGQAFNPGHFRDIGVGVINGSLWTITTEVLFYISVPIIASLVSRSVRYLYFLIFLSFAIYVFGPTLLGQVIFREKTIYDLFALTPIPWGWMFGLGILLHINFLKIIQYIKYFPLAIIPLVAMWWTDGGFLFGSSGNRIGLLYFLCYAAVIIYLAFGVRAVRSHFDISYGVYIWHMPIINLLIVCSVVDPGSAFGLALLATFAAATVSWFLVEKPALRMKRKALRSYDTATVKSESL